MNTKIKKPISWTKKINIYMSSKSYFYLLFLGQESFFVLASFCFISASKASKESPLPDGADPILPPVPHIGLLDTNVLPGTIFLNSSFW